ncbi:MAG TPA: ESX secretion-associated protein EspG [Pseudonocardiaceae bacterium]
MTATMTDPVVFHPVEVDLLCSLGEVRAPFPLDIPSTGTTGEERRHVFGVAREQLTARGLADDRGPQGVAAVFVRMLRSCAGTVDIVVAENGHNSGAVALVDELHALLVTQSPKDPDRMVQMVELATDDAVRELLALVPMLPAGTVPAFTVPLPPVRKVFQSLDQRRRVGQSESLSDDDIDSLLWESGVDERMASRLVDTMRQVTGSGQVGATRWLAGPDRWERLGDEPHWVDTGRGRFRISQSADGLWASVSPFSRTDIRAELRKLAARVRGVR